MLVAAWWWESISGWPGAEKREKIKEDIQRRLRFAEFDVHFISALHGTGVGTMIPSRMPTGQPQIS